MTSNERTPMAKFFDVLAYESDVVQVTHASDKSGANQAINVKLSCGFAKFEKNDQKYEFSFNHQKQEIDHDCFEAIREKLSIIINNQKFN